MVPDHSPVRRDYGNDRIVVHWDSGLCMHSRNCVRGLPVVFDLRKRPWVQVDQADADAVAAAVDTCPSRALTYSRLDGAPLGSNGVADTDVLVPAEATTDDAPEAATPVVIALRPDGPLVVEGCVRIELTRGEVVTVTDRAVLCRCGGSGNKPFCDGSHQRTGFEAEG